MPAEFRFSIDQNASVDPLHNDSRTRELLGRRFHAGIGRVRPGSTIQQAQAGYECLQSHVGSPVSWRWPASWNANVSVCAAAERHGCDVRARLLILLGAVGLILADCLLQRRHLTLSRAATREKEISIVPR